MGSTECGWSLATCARARRRVHDGGALGGNARSSTRTPAHLAARTRHAADTMVRDLPLDIRYARAARKTEARERARLGASGRLLGVRGGVGALAVGE